MRTNGGFLISQIKQLSGRMFNSLLLKKGIEEFNGAQGRILYVLWQEDRLPIAELARRTGLAKTTLTGMLDRMEERGFLQRIPALEDRRQLLIVLTPKAREWNGRYEEVSDEMSEIFYKGFEPEEIVFFEKTLERILKNLQEQQEGG